MGNSTELLVLIGSVLASGAGSAVLFLIRSARTESSIEARLTALSAVMEQVNTAVNHGRMERVEATVQRVEACVAGLQGAVSGLQDSARQVDAVAAETTGLSLWRLDIERRFASLETQVVDVSNT